MVIKIVRETALRAAVVVGVMCLICGCGKIKVKGADAADSEEEAAAVTLPDIKDLPYSVFDTKPEATNYVGMYVDDDYRVYLHVVGDGTSGEDGDAELRKRVFEEAGLLYAEISGAKVTLTYDQCVGFVESGIVGSPIRNVGTDSQDALTGIPYNVYPATNNVDLDMWMRAIYSAAGEKLKEKIRSGTGIVVIASGAADFMKLQQIFDNLVDARFNKVSVLTSLLELTMDGEVSYQLYPEKRTLAPLHLLGSKWAPLVVEDCEVCTYIARNYVPDGCMDACNDGGDDSDDAGESGVALADIEEEVEEEEEVPISEQEARVMVSECNTGLPRSRVVDFEVTGEFPFTGMCQFLQITPSGFQSSGFMPFFGEYVDGVDNTKNCIDGLIRFNYSLWYDIRELVGLRRRGAISAADFEARKRDLMSEANTAGITPIVLIEPRGATLSTVMAAVSAMEVTYIPQYWIVTGWD